MPGKEFPTRASRRHFQTDSLRLKLIQRWRFSPSYLKSIYRMPPMSLCICIARVYRLVCGRVDDWLNSGMACYKETTFVGRCKLKKFYNMYVASEEIFIRSSGDVGHIEIVNSLLIPPVRQNFPVDKTVNLDPPRRGPVITIKFLERVSSPAGNLSYCRKNDQIDRKRDACSETWRVTRS